MVTDTQFLIPGAEPLRRAVPWGRRWRCSDLSLSLEVWFHQTRPVKLKGLISTACALAASPAGPELLTAQQRDGRRPASAGPVRRAPCPAAPAQPRLSSSGLFRSTLKRISAQLLVVQVEGGEGGVFTARYSAAPPTRADLSSLACPLVALPGSGDTESHLGEQSRGGGGHGRLLLGARWTPESRWGGAGSRLGGEGVGSQPRGTAYWALGEGHEPCPWSWHLFLRESVSGGKSR